MEYLVYKDNVNSCWVEADSGKSFGFGHFVFTCLNTANAMKDKETFVNSESVWLSDNNRMAKILGWLDDSGKVSKEKLSEYYDNAIQGNESILSWKDEFEMFVEYMKNLQQFRNSETSKTDLLGIYTRFKYFFTAICSEQYSYIPPTDNKRNDFFDSRYSDLISFKGFCILGDEKGNYVNATPCETFECAELFDIFILDFWEFLFNPACQNKSIRFCKHCGSMFIDSNNKAKYCEVCRQPEIMAKIRYANRKSNKARKLHQEVLTLAYGFAKKPNNDSNAFLNESNYYWDIVQGKKPEKVKGYSNRIKTEEQYISWLERKREHFKKTNQS